MTTYRKIEDHRHREHRTAERIIVLKNFEIRQTARDQEIEALKQAKAILSGANFSEFLQGA